MKIMALDPGGTTGWSIFEVAMDGDRPMFDDILKCFTRAGQLDREGHHATLWRFLDKENPDTIVMERYEKRNNDFSLLISVEYVGVAKAWAALRRKVLVFQGASQALHFMDEGSKLARLNLVLEPYTKWKDANASLKHLVFY